MAMVVGVCRISLLLEDCQSLKDKRSVLRRIKDRVGQKYNCAIAEVGDPENFASAQLGFAVVSNDRTFTRSMVQQILNFIDDLSVAKLIDDEQDFIDYGDGSIAEGLSGDYAHWEPDEPSPPKPQPGLPKPVRLESESYPWDSPEPAAPPVSSKPEAERKP
jgi:hypothetical protein